MFYQFFVSSLSPSHLHNHSYSGTSHDLGVTKITTEDTQIIKNASQGFDLNKKVRVKAQANVSLTAHLLQKYYIQVSLAIRGGYVPKKNLQSRIIKPAF
jgi:hypothetical protein